MDSTHSPLLRAFAAQVAGLAPRTVLDVGCGRGAVLQLLAQLPELEASLTLGLEASAGSARHARELGCRVARASAASLPCADRSFDVVCLRHVPHHLPQLGACLKEAWRVARKGLVLAEPYFDVQLPGQGEGLAADRWLKSLDRRRGEYHADSHSAAELLALIPEEPASTRVEVLLPLVPWHPAELETRRRQSQGELALTPDERQQWSGILDSARAGGVSRNGTMMLILLR